MKLLFLSIGDIPSINHHEIYPDLLREFKKHGDEVYIVCCKDSGSQTEVIEEQGSFLLKVCVKNIKQSNYIKKGISTILLPYLYNRAIKKYYSEIKFDLLLYSTPPITIYGLVNRLKRTTKAKTVLMLKDIWPQEMVDLGLIAKDSLIYKYFKNSEEKIYSVSDFIGYTSAANKQYLLSYGISDRKLIQINNSVDKNYVSNVNDEVPSREKYGIKDSDVLFFCGGSLGKPQDVDYIISCIDTQINRDGVYFVICGKGTEYWKLEEFINRENPRNMKLFHYLPKNEYDNLIRISDVGIVFLNHKFTVPNCPSRFYAYMEYSKPVFACTDTATDIKDDIRDGGFGWWCESNDVQQFSKMIDSIIKEGRYKLMKRGGMARNYLEKYYTVDKDYKRIMDALLEIQ